MGTSFMQLLMQRSENKIQMLEKIQISDGEVN